MGSASRENGVKDLADLLRAVVFDVETTFDQALALMFDAVVCCAVHPGLAFHRGVVSRRHAVDFVSAPVREDGQQCAIERVTVKAGRRMGTAFARDNGAFLVW